MTPPSRLFVGGFSAEEEWGGTDRIQLSPLRTSAETTSGIAAGMSELLAVLSEPKDRVGVLAWPDEALSESYRRLGREVQWTLCPVYAGGSIPDHSLIEVQPFAVTARLASYFERAERPWRFPSLKTIARVNSKAWSHSARRGFIRFDAKWAGTASEVDRVGREMLSSGDAIVVKEEFGVSGKGNCVVRDVTQLQSMVRLIVRQEAQDRPGGFVIEPLFDKLVDFSGHFTVHEDGHTQLDGFRQMLNVGHRYVASAALPDRLRNQLLAADYFREAEAVLAALVKERYFGPVCIDGLIARDGTVVSTLEVNARASMGRLSLALDEATERQGLQTILFTLRVRAQGDKPFARVVAELDRRRLLFGEGVAGRFLLLGGSSGAPGNAEQRWFGGYWFSSETDPMHDFAELLAAAQACDVSLDHAQLRQLPSLLQQAQRVACSA